MVAMSPNLMVALGLAKPSQEPAATKEGGEGGGMGDWRPPMFSGLTNSKPLTTLMPVVVGHNKKALEVQYKNKGGEDGQDGDVGDGEWSEEEGWDYEGAKCERKKATWCCCHNGRVYLSFHVNYMCTLLTCI